MKKVKLSSLVVVINKYGFVEVKPYAKCTKKEKSAETTSQFDEFMSHNCSEFNVKHKDLKVWIK
jgi:hypothetical protein